jgi:hypothetical protein
MERYGVVFISRGFSYNDTHRVFIGHWEAEDPPQNLEAGPGWDDVEEAVAWGRERALKVLVRLGATEDSIYSAGESPVTRLSDGTGEAYPEWPPLE